jgi:hypothetical protein
MSGAIMDMEAVAKKPSIASKSANPTGSELKPIWPVCSGGPSNRLVGLWIDDMGATIKSGGVGSWCRGGCLWDGTAVAEREDEFGFPSRCSAALTAEAILVG